MPSEEEAVYRPKDAVGLAIESTLITGAAGLTVSAIQNTLTKQNVSGWGVFTRSGGTIAVFGVLLLLSTIAAPRDGLTGSIAAMGGTYGFSKAAAANLREKNDSWNPAIGGFLAGGVLGMKCWVAIHPWKAAILIDL